MLTPSDAKPFVSRLAAIACALALVHGLVTVWLHPDYGPTWDSILAEYPYGEAYVLTAGEDGDYLERSAWHADLGFRDPHPDFSVGKLRWVGTYPFTGFFSGIFCKVFWTELGWLPALTAHDLVILPYVSVLIIGLVVLLGKRYGWVAGVSAAVLLVTAPRFFAHSFNNLKDVPEACLYNATLVVLYGAFRSGKLRYWAFAGVLLGCTLAQRPNAFFLPPQFALFLVTAFLIRRAQSKSHLVWSWKGLGLASLLFGATWFAANPVFWTDTADRLREWSTYTFGFNTFLNDENVALNRMTPPTTMSTEALWLCLTTTPAPLLILALIGLFARGVSLEIRAFLLIGAAVPIGRTLIPGFPQYDGVRHYLEFYPPLAALAGLGVRFLVDQGARVSKFSTPVVVLLTVAPGIYAAASTHPNGIAYFNAFAGGLSGAQADGVRDATDYWGNSYWQGLDWLEAEAEPGATLLVPIAPHIVGCVAPIKLRADLHFPEDATAELSGPLYVMYMTREGLYSPLLTRLDALSPIHEIRVQDAPILRIHRLEGEAAQTAYAEWGFTLEQMSSGRTLLRWLKDEPDRMRQGLDLLNGANKLGVEETTRQLEALIPPRMHAEIPRLLKHFGARAKK